MSHSEPELQNIPVPSTPEGRRLREALRERRCENERCQALLPPGHPAVYCTNECAVEDA